MRHPGGDLQGADHSGKGLRQITFLILLAGVVLALALAFGIGGRDWAADLLARWFPRGKTRDR